MTKASNVSSRVPSAGDYEASLIDDFAKHLPEPPPWK